MVVFRVPLLLSLQLAVAAAAVMTAAAPAAPPAAVASPTVTCGPPPPPYSADSALSVTVAFYWDNASHPNTTEVPVLRGGIELVFSLAGMPNTSPRGPVSHLGMTHSVPPYNVTNMSYPSDPAAGAAACQTLCDASQQPCLSWVFSSTSAASPTTSNSNNTSTSTSTSTSSFTAPQTCALYANVGCPYELMDTWAGATVDNAPCVPTPQVGGDVGGGTTLLQGPLPVALQPSPPPPLPAENWTAFATGLLTGLRAATTYFVVARTADSVDYQSMVGWGPISSYGVNCTTTNTAVTTATTAATSGTMEAGGAYSPRRRAGVNCVCISVCVCDYDVRT
jgi:hypothetical protein